MEVHAFIATVKEISGSCNYCKLLRCFVPIQSISQPISQNVYSVPSRYLLRRRSRPRPSRKEQSLEGGGIGNWHRLGGALDLLEVYSGILGQPQKINRSQLSQSWRMGPPNYFEQKTEMYDALYLYIYIIKKNIKT